LLPVFWQRYKKDKGVKARELRELSSEELQHKQQELIEELFNLRFQLATSQIENVGRIAAVRRDIARVKTVQHERQRQSAP
jgi:large subunit ribosomal protein L29